MLIDRRGAVLGGAFGLGALAFPGGALATGLLTATGYTHNVASGEPGPSSVLLWTRYVPKDGTDTRLVAEISDTVDFVRALGGGTAVAKRDADFTARVTATGLEPGRWYFYRFIAPDGSISPTGRTRTLPVGPVRRFGIGLFSCANMAFGYFNGYAHAAERGDLDLLIHAGDYLYEYRKNQYPGVEIVLRNQLVEPADELIHLADYRMRYAGYRTDPDLQRLHQLFPMIAQRDDHEVADNAWKDGAGNHQANEGDYAVRKRAGIQANNEWLPVSGAPWSSYDIGELATIFRPETRCTARSRPIDLSGLVQRGDGLAQLQAFRDGPYRDPERTMLGAEQEDWLGQELNQSVKRGALWQVLVSQTMVGTTFKPPEVAAFVRPGLPAFVAEEAQMAAALSHAGIPANLDAWDGFPAARSRLLAAAQSADADLVVLSGDDHNAWAFDLAEGGKRAGVEFTGQSVSSPGTELFLAPERLAEFRDGCIAASPELKWAEVTRRGYMSVELTPDRVTGEWNFLDTVHRRTTALAGTHRISAEHGRREFSR